MQFSFGLIRDFSRNDLTDDFHQHQNGHISMSVSLYGPGTRLSFILVILTGWFMHQQGYAAMFLLSAVHNFPKFLPKKAVLIMYSLFVQNLTTLHRQNFAAVAVATAVNNTCLNKFVAPIKPAHLILVQFWQNKTIALWKPKKLWF
ncbi:MAG: hypothetical protein JNM24_08185 [Bdellovibrionaceae bacterium]|nr:hypothetical protein [Pseudobdellovibrionaceae bacterium]